MSRFDLQASKPKANFRLVRASAERKLAKYAGPTQAPFSEDISKQRTGDASPFQMSKVPVKPNGKGSG